MVRWKRLKLPRLVFNAPATLGFTLICTLALALGAITDGASSRLLFSVYRTRWIDPLGWLRLLTHVFGHSGWDHFTGNILYILILGPMLEEKYGTGRMVLLMAVTALVTGLMCVFFLPGTRMMGASGIVFAFILLSSITGTRDQGLPVTFLLVAVIYIGQQVYQAVFVREHIAYAAHIVGGLVGACAGFLMKRA